MTQSPKLRLATEEKLGPLKGHIVTNPRVARADRATLFDVPMPGNSNVMVHPSVYYNADGVSGYKYWMAYTPYPSANSQMENPCIVASHDGTTWVTPAGVVNPIEPAPAAWPGEYNSDPYLTRANDGTFYLFWRMVGYPNGKESWFYYTSQDLISWTNRTLLLSTTMTAERFVAASIFQEPNGNWVFYGVETVQSPYRMYKLEAPTLAGLSGAARQVCTFTGDWNGVQPWHIDVHRVGGEVQVLVQDGNSGGGNLWAAVSKDGLTFVAGKQLVDNGLAAEWDFKYYKSCFVPTIKDGIWGWDIWVTSNKFPATGPAQGRSFVYFDGRQAEKARQAIAEQDTKILFARAGIWPFNIGDSFSSADSTGLGTSETGHLWTVTNGSYNIVNKAAVAMTTGNNKAYVEAGFTDHWPTIRIDSLPSLGQHWVMTRFADASNHYRFGSNGTDWVLEKVIGAASTTLATFPNMKSLIGVARTYIGLRMVGTTLEPYINGVKVGSVVDSALTAGTKVGFQASPTNATFRAFTNQVS